MKPHADYFDEKIDKGDTWLFKKKYLTMVVLGYVDKKTGNIKSVSALPTAISIGIFLVGLLIFLLPSLLIVVYTIFKAGGRCKEFREKLGAENI